jgi:flagellar assembly protein FliH
MISPSEDLKQQAEDHAVLSAPERILQQDPRARKEVSRLEFHSVKRVIAEQQSTVESKPAALETELLLKEEMAALDGRLRSQAAEMSVQIEAARSEGRVAARREWEEELQERLEVERQKVVRTCEEFSRERMRYFAGVESEVVKLALAVAKRVLHREAELDPMLLTAVVRVALEKVAEDSATVLRVPVDEVALWQDVFGAESSVQVMGEERFSAGECVLETNVGRVELGVKAQLAEIERGFFDLLQQRPA